MKLFKYTKVKEQHSLCPECGRYTSADVKRSSAEFYCSCGWRVTVNENGKILDVKIERKSA